MTKDAKERKETPIKTGVLDYFPDAIRAVAKCSYIGNEQHNPGTALHWDRSKSGDELDALTRHLMDAGTVDSDGIRHSAKVAWRALANLQKEIERDKLEEWQEEILERYKDDDEPCMEYLSPLCPSDFCPCKEEEIEKRMNVIGQNGNDGLHYDSNPISRYTDPDGALASDSVWLATSTERPDGWDNTGKLNINGATVTYEVQETKREENDK